MAKKTFVFFVLIASMILISGCTQSISDEELYAKLLDANTNLDTYKVEMNIMMTMDTEMLGEEMVMESIMTSSGEIDRKNRKLHMASFATTNTPTMNREVETEQYIIDDKFYTQSDGTWLSMSLEDDVWNQNDQMVQMIALLKSGKLERQSDATLDGKSYYVIKVEPDMGVVASLYLNEDQYDSDSANNLRDMIKEYTATVWIDKETYVMEKSVTNMAIDMGSGESGSLSSGGSMLIEYTIEMRIKDIGMPVDITLSDEAKNAIDMEDMWSQMNGMDTD